MTEYEFKKMFEKYAENIFKELWVPHYNIINNTFDELEEACNKLDEKLNGIYKKTTKQITDIQNSINTFSKHFKKDISVLNVKLEELNNSIETKLEESKTTNAAMTASNINLEKKLLQILRSEIEETKYYGKQAMELCKDISLQRTLDNCKQKLHDECVAHVQNLMVLEKRITELKEGLK